MNEIARTATAFLMGSLALAAMTPAHALDLLGATPQETIDSLKSAAKQLETSDPAPTGASGSQATATPTIRTRAATPDSASSIVAAGNALKTSDPFTIPPAR